MQGFDLDFVAPDLEFVVSGLDFVSRNLDFLSGDLEILHRARVSGPPRVGGKRLFVKARLLLV
jgi:hypothetical protein